MYKTRTKNALSASNFRLGEISSPGTYFAAILAKGPTRGLRRVLLGGELVVVE